MKKITLLASILTLLTLVSCSVYSFTGGSTGDAKTVQVDYFPNSAPLVEPTVSQKLPQSCKIYLRVKLI